MQEITCQNCDNTVFVERNAENQVCVQWSAESAESCREFQQRAAQGECRSRFIRCSALNSAIDLRVRNGLIPISARALSAEFPVRPQGQT